MNLLFRLVTIHLVNHIQWVSTHTAHTLCTCKHKQIINNSESSHSHTMTDRRYVYIPVHHKITQRILYVCVFVKLYERPNYSLVKFHVLQPIPFHFSEISQQKSFPHTLQEQSLSCVFETLSKRPFLARFISIKIAGKKRPKTYK